MYYSFTSDDQYSFFRMVRIVEQLEPVFREVMAFVDEDFYHLAA